MVVVMVSIDILQPNNTQHAAYLCNHSNNVGTSALRYMIFPVLFGGISYSNIQHPS